MTRLRTQLAHALGAAPRDTLEGVVRYLRLSHQTTRLLQGRGLDEALTELDAARSIPRPISSPPTLILRLGEAFSRGSRTCLDRALARYAFLRSLGLSPVFVIGVDPARAADESDALGHAWVEVDDEPWPPEDVQLYRPSYRHPPRASLTHPPRFDVRATSPSEI